MTILDILILILTIGGAVYGWKRGIIRQAGQVAAVISGIIVCRVFGHRIVGLFSSTGDNTLEHVLVYVVLFIVVYVGVNFMARSLKTIAHKLCLGLFDRLGGVIFTVAEWLFLLSLALNLWGALMASPVETDNKPWREKVMILAPEVLASAHDFTENATGANPGQTTDVNTDNEH